MRRIVDRKVLSGSYRNGIFPSYSTSINSKIESKSSFVESRTAYRIIKDFCIKYYKHGGARKEYYKIAAREGKELTSSLVKDVLSSQGGVVIEKLTVNVESKSPKLRQSFLLDHNVDGVAFEISDHVENERKIDVAVLHDVLTRLSAPEERSDLVLKQSQRLKSPGVNGHPHRSGLLFVFEPASSFYKNGFSREPATDRVRHLSPYDSEIIANWKRGIQCNGFELIKHQKVCLFETADDVNGCGRLEEHHLFILRKDGRDINKLTPDKSLLCISEDFSPLNVCSNLSHCETSQSRSTGRNDNCLPIAIIGGGIGGAALALALQEKNIPFKLFEKDTSLRIRKQGYALTIQQGVKALRNLGLWPQILAAGVTSQSHVSLTSSGEVIGAYGIRKLDQTHPLAVQCQPSSQQVVDVVASFHHRYRHLEASSYLHRNFEGDLSNNSRDEVCGINERSTTKDSEETAERMVPQRLNVHIPRQQLREIMLRAIDSKNICWGKKLLSIRRSQQNNLDGEQGLVICFEDGSSYEVSGLVGADGIFSDVRKILERNQENKGIVGLENSVRKPLRYLGLMVVLGISPLLLSCDYQEQSLERAPPPNTSGDRLRRQIQWLDGSTRIFTMPFDRLHTMWQLSFPMGEHEIESFQGSQTKLKELSLSKISGWHEPLVAMVKQTDTQWISGHAAFDRDPLSNDELAFLTRSCALEGSPPPTNALDRPAMTDCPVEDAVSGLPITLIGDAAHPMSPFKGQGANQALLDAFSLSKHISRSRIGWGAKGAQPALAASFRSFEEEMCSRSSEKVLKSRMAAQFLHSPLALTKANITRAAAAESALSLDES